MCATMGVLPVPPTLRLPTLITGRRSRRRRAGSRAYQRRRQPAAAPYSTLIPSEINSSSRGNSLPCLTTRLCTETGACAAAERLGPAERSMDQPEGPHDGTTLWGTQLGDDRESFVFGAPVGFNERARGRAQSGPPYGICQEGQQRLLQLPF